MKMLKRNQQKFNYALYTGRSEIVDSDGMRTGQFTNTYASAVTDYAYISAARGEAQEDAFGINLNYSKTLITDDMNCPISETTRLWVDDLTGDYDYIVVQKAKSLNHIAYAIRKVDAQSGT